MSSEEILYPQLNPSDSNNNAQATEASESNEETSINNIPTACILGCGKHLLLKEMKTHLVTECENVEVNCPQLCGKKVARKDINNHLDNLCANTKPCMLAEFGCSYVARGVDCDERLNDHLKEKAIDHISLLTNIIKSHETKLNQPKPCKQKLKALKSKLCNLKQVCKSIPICEKLKPYSGLLTVLAFFFVSIAFQSIVRFFGFGCFARMFLYSTFLAVSVKFCRKTKMTKKMAFGVLVTSFALCSLSGFCEPRIRTHQGHFYSAPTPQHVPLQYPPRFVHTPAPQINIQTVPIHQQPPQQAQKPHHTCSKPQQVPQDWFGRATTQQQQQPAAFRLFKPCMLESVAKKRQPFAPVFGNTQGHFSTLKKTGTLVGYISEKYFHGSAPVYVYQDPHHNVFYTVDYLPEDQFPQYVRIGKLGYVDGDRLTCKA